MAQSLPIELWIRLLPPHAVHVLNKALESLPQVPGSQHLTFLQAFYLHFHHKAHGMTLEGLDGPERTCGQDAY